MCIYPTMLVIFSQTFFPYFSLGVHVCMTVNTLAFKKKKKNFKVGFGFSWIFVTFNHLFPFLIFIFTTKSGEWP